MKIKVFFSTLLLLFVLNVGSVAFAATVPVYRIYNPRSGEHLYTADSNERNVLLRNGWRNEGIGWRAPTSGRPVYRLYHPGSGDHLFTANTLEINTLTSQRGWVKDFGGRPIFYSGGSVIVWRLCHFKTYKHHLTADFNEFAALPSFGWKQEGIFLYAVSR